VPQNISQCKILTDDQKSIYLDSNGRLSREKLQTLAEEVHKCSVAIPLASAVLGSEQLLTKWKKNELTPAVSDEAQDSVLEAYLNEEHPSQQNSKKLLLQNNTKVAEAEEKSRIPRIRITSNSMFPDSAYARLYLWKNDRREVMFLITQRELQDKIDSVFQNGGRWSQDIISVKDEQRHKVAHELFHLLAGQDREVSGSSREVHDAEKKVIEKAADIFADICVEIRSQESCDIVASRQQATKTTQGLAL
jgi:hypothetical protein